MIPPAQYIVFHLSRLTVDIFHWLQWSGYWFQLAIVHTISSCSLTLVCCLGDLSNLIWCCWIYCTCLMLTFLSSCWESKALAARSLSWYLRTYAHIRNQTRKPVEKHTPPQPSIVGSTSLRFAVFWLSVWVGMLLYTTKRECAAG